MQRIVLPKYVDNIISIIKIVFIVIYLFTFPLSLIFDEVGES